MQLGFQQNQGNRPMFQQNQGQRAYNNRPFQPYNPNYASTSKEIVPVQNNLVQDFEWCYPCNQPHNQNTCVNGMINQALMIQSMPGNQQAITNEVSTPNQVEQQPETTLLNWPKEDFCGVNHDGLAIVDNMRRKKRALDAKIPEKVATIPDKLVAKMVTNQAHQIPSNQRISPRGQPLPVANQSTNVPK